MFLRTIQEVTQRIQIKGVAKLAFRFRGLLRNRSHQYRCYNDLKLHIDEDVLYQWWYTVNYSSFDVLKIMERHLVVGDTFVDVGANIGFLSLNAARLVGTSGSVIAVDPQVGMPEQIRNNATANGLDNVTIVEAAISDEVGEASFNVATDAGLSRLDNRKGSSFGMEPSATHTVKKTTLDNLMTEQLGGIAPTFVKVDVEGHEYQVLQGASKLLEQKKSILVLEINPGGLRENDIQLSDILDVLRPLGYTAYWIESHYRDWLRFCREPSLDGIDMEAPENQRSGDIVAFPPGKNPR